MPSPPPPRTPRTCRMTVRLTGRELAALRRRARAVGLPLSDYLRASALGSRVRMRPGSLEREAIAQLARIANNLRQLQAVAREAGQPDEVLKIGAVLEEVGAVMDDLLGEGDIGE